MIECGHHCGKKDGYVGHCNCPECHGTIDPQLVERTMADQSYVDIKAARNDLSSI